jgi:hypothetical protein
MKRPTVGRVLVLALISAVLGTSVVAVGQDRTRGGDRETRGREETAPAADAEEGDDEPGSGAETEVVKEGGETVTIIKFGAIDVSGRLKSPQLLYFLNRLRAEFDRPRLPHRSFMPELVRSTKAKGMK